jgi:hypothetical protein
VRVYIRTYNFFCFFNRRPHNLGVNIHAHACILNSVDTSTPMARCTRYNAM